jgi:hypothetical protein
MLLINQQICLGMMDSSRTFGSFRPADVYEKGQARFPVQTVVRPKRKNTTISGDMQGNYMVII